MTLPHTLPELAAWWDRASVRTRSEVVAMMIEDIEIKPSTRPRGSRGIETSPLLFHFHDFVTIDPIKIIEKVWRADSSH